MIAPIVLDGPINADAFELCIEKIPGRFVSEHWE